MKNNIIVMETYINGRLVAKSAKNIEKPIEWGWIIAGIISILFMIWSVGINGGFR